mmetsp:Transcript_87856/g.284403  ORF Transcript_87856/g.284403 Transcript_87856/m.284403 type:complete len:239 (-) Transcript_87856:346-1062(-)
MASGPPPGPAVASPPKTTASTRDSAAWWLSSILPRPRARSRHVGLPAEPVNISRKEAAAASSPRRPLPKSTCFAFEECVGDAMYVRTPSCRGEACTEAAARGVAGSLTQTLPGKMSVSLSRLRPRGFSRHVGQPVRPSQRSSPWASGVCAAPSPSSKSRAMGAPRSAWPGGTRFRKPRYTGLGGATPAPSSSSPAGGDQPRRAAPISRPGGPPSVSRSSVCPRTLCAWLTSSRSMRLP